MAETLLKVAIGGCVLLDVLGVALLVKYQWICIKEKSVVRKFRIGGG